MDTALQRSEARRERLPEQRPESARKDRSDLAVGGMTCQNCVRHVIEALQQVPGVADVEVDLSTGRARVRWTAGTGKNEEALVESVREAG
jgi:copper chaperone CopZ